MKGIYPDTILFTSALLPQELNLTYSSVTLPLLFSPTCDHGHKQFYLPVFKRTQHKASENFMYFKKTGRSTKAKFETSCERNEATEKGDLKPSPFNFVLTLIRMKLEALKKKKRPLLRNTFQDKHSIRDNNKAIEQ